ncbi:RNA polymerase sigma factor [Alicyclobacillus fodiniaquatilis]|uniref:Sigma factor n=1 Tax=Alicyclobacillus fodiniaquatilis TaxID=1661150 RepID=A0ABW4JKW8_9BACL
MNDNEDVVRAKEGDTKAFERLVEKHISSVLQVVKRILPSGEIDDVVQDVWLHVFVGLDGLREPALFEKWIRTIAYNRAMQWHRKSYAETAGPGVYICSECVEECAKILDEQRVADK